MIIYGNYFRLRKQQTIGGSLTTINQQSLLSQQQQRRFIFPLFLETCSKLILEFRCTVVRITEQ